MDNNSLLVHSKSWQMCGCLCTAPTTLVMAFASHTQLAGQQTASKSAAYILVLTSLNVSKCILMMRYGHCYVETKQHFLHKYSWDTVGTNPHSSCKQHAQQERISPNKSPLLAPKMLLAVCSVSSRVFLPELSSLMACRKILKLSLDSRCLHQTAQLAVSAASTWQSV